MAKIKLIAMGQLTERYYRDAADDYIRRMAPRSPVREVELKCVRLPDSPSEKEIGAALAKEGNAILEEIPKRAFVSALCVEGKELSSVELATLLADAEVTHGEICFLIGSSYGLDERVKARAHLRLSMSRMTFPHMLARVVLLEQLYRAGEINQGKKYHK